MAGSIATFAAILRCIIGLVANFNVTFGDPMGSGIKRMFENLRKSPTSFLKV